MGDVGDANFVNAEKGGTRGYAEEYLIQIKAKIQSPAGLSRCS